MNIKRRGYTLYELLIILVAVGIILLQVAFVYVIVHFVAKYW